jgi:Flp pilus assembly pilin Flp
MRTQEFKMRLLIAFSRDNSGSNALEYGLIVAFISLAVVVGAQTAGNALGTMFSTIGANVASIAVPTV